VGGSIPRDTQNSPGSNPGHSLTSKPALLSAGDWSRWPPEVSSYLHWYLNDSNSDLCLPETKNPDIVRYERSHSNTEWVKSFPSQIFYWPVAAIIKYKAGAHSRTIHRKHSWFSKSAFQTEAADSGCDWTEKKNKPKTQFTKSGVFQKTSRNRACWSCLVLKRPGVCCRYQGHQTNSTLVLSHNFRSSTTSPVALQPPQAPLSAELIYGALTLLFEALQILTTQNFSHKINSPPRFPAEGWHSMNQTKGRIEFPAPASAFKLPVETAVIWQQAVWRCHVLLCEGLNHSTKRIQTEKWVKRAAAGKGSHNIT